MNYDVVIIGAGAAGLYAACSFAQNKNNMKILVLAKRELRVCNSNLAQGGIAGVSHPENPKTPAVDDSAEFHEHDTKVAGCFKNDTNAVRILVNEAKHDIINLIKYGVNFDKNPDGTYHRTLEGGHSKRRIFHHKDMTGAEIVAKLAKYAMEVPNIDFRENTAVLEIQKREETFGILTADENGLERFHAPFVIMATGGIGQVYSRTTNSETASGDGISLAYELGANVKNMRYIQFHPTAFSGTREEQRQFLVSEAVRGEGAYLVNSFGERFMGNYDNRLELAPRDVISKSILSEQKRLGSRDFFLDISHKPKDYIIKHFPAIYDELLKKGFDMARDRIPVYPCQHYLMGGIEVDLHSRTTVEGLYAVGECSHTGVHGKNRLASNSLLEAIVFSRRATEDISMKINADATPQNVVKTENLKDFKEFSPSINLEEIKSEVRELMQTTYFVIPNNAKVKTSLERVGEIRVMLEKKRDDMKKQRAYSRELAEVKALANIAFLVLNDLL